MMTPAAAADIETLTIFFFYWMTAFSIIEPITSLLFFGKRHQLKTSNNGVAVLCDFFYRTNVLLFPMFIWNNILNRGYFPDKDDYKGLVEYIALYCIFLVLIDIIWDHFVMDIPYFRSIKYMDIFERYELNDQPLALLGDAVQGASWIALTWWMYHNVSGIMAFNFLFSGLLILTLISA